MTWWYQLYYATSVVLFAMQLFLIITLLEFYNDLPLHNTLIPHPCSAIQALIKLARQTRSVDQCNKGTRKLVTLIIPISPSVILVLESHYKDVALSYNIPYMVQNQSRAIFFACNVTNFAPYMVVIVIDPGHRNQKIFSPFPAERAGKLFRFRALD